MIVRLYKDSDKNAWDRYVMQSGNSSCYHLIGWKDVIEKIFGHKTYYLMATEDSPETDMKCQIIPANSTICGTAAQQHCSTEVLPKTSNLQPQTISVPPTSNLPPLTKVDPSNRIVGILPIVHLKSLLFGNFMVSVPYFNYGGLCSDRADVKRELLKEAIRIAEETKAGHIELRHSHKFGDGLPEKTSKVSMILELPDKADDLWKTFPSKLRSQVRKPEKEGMHARLGREEELNSFYQVFSANMRDLGTPVYPKKFFRNILTKFPETSRICSVYTKDDRTVASGFLVAFKDRLEIPWASSLKEYNRFGPNMLLYWSVLKFACEKGYRILDFGRSTVGEGTFKFKEQWGAKPVQLYWHYWLKNGGPLPELNPHNPKYQLAIKLWQRLPVSLTRFIGPFIVKNLP